MAVISLNSKKKRNTRSGTEDGRIPIGVCLLVFFVLCLVNSLLSQGEVGSFLYDTSEANNNDYYGEEDMAMASTTSNEENEKKKKTRMSRKTQQEQLQQPASLINQVVSTTGTATTATAATTTTKTTRKNSNVNSPVALSENARLFYKKHQQEMKNLINMTTIMDWNRDRRKRGKYRQWLDEFNYFEIKDKSTRLEDAQGYDFIYYRNDLCLVAQLFTKYRQQTDSVPLPHVLLLRYNQDFGALSSDLGGLNRPMRNLPKLWKKGGCSHDYVMDYVNHPDTLAVFTNQYHVVHHSKIISIPLGLSGSPPDLLLEHIDKVQTAERDQLFMLNTNVMQKRTRNRDVAILVGNFRHQIHNTYPDYTAKAGGGSKSFSTVTARTLYYEEMLRSQFIWSPPGLGLDCYRHWESLYLGTIPVLRHDNRFETDGWLSHVFEELPVAWVENYQQLTPSFLEKEYERIVNNWESYNYRKLTRQYWIELANSYVKNHKNKKQKNKKHQEQ